MDGGDVLQFGKRGSNAHSAPSPVWIHRRFAGFAVLLAAAALMGCHRHRKAQPIEVMMAPPPKPAFTHYHQSDFDWSRVGRVLVLPVFNNSTYTRAGAEMRHAIAGELQKQGQFEVVAPPADHPTFLSETIHINGRFDETVMMAMARDFNADIILHTAVTQYSPYPRPCLGLVVQAVSPIDGKVVAAIDGLWDTSDADIACQVREYYRSPMPSRRFHKGVIPVAHYEDGHADELALESPMLFQRFVASEVAANLAAPAVTSTMISMPISPILPRQP